ncbi:sensor histidine kinase [Clostridium sp.]|uniref:sensor histidine kinase n=1 Tax=Clostridium sp. TaxID=1506 RepID=UPI0025C40703|nr:sensor histidine kinase [Clostridium sp.]
MYSIAFKIFNVSFSEMFLIINYKRSILVFIVKIIQFVLLSFFIKNLNFIKLIKDVTLYSLAIILLLDHILVFIIERDVIANRDIINIDIITILFSLCSIQVLLIYILTIFLKEMEEKFLLKMNLNRKIHDKEIRDMYTEMIGWRHDFKNHISVILGLLQVSGKEAVIEYINEIDNSMSKLDKNIYTDNIAVNSILLSKIKIAEEKNIDIRLNLKINSKIKISNVDISTVLGNLIDNSIEACTNVKGYRFINLKIASENNILVFKISNSTNGYINEVNGRFLSTKNTEVSGIGLSQVDNIIKKYNGYINRSHKNNIFTTYIMIQ